MLQQFSMLAQYSHWYEWLILEQLVESINSKKSRVAKSRERKRRGSLKSTFIGYMRIQPSVYMESSIYKVRNTTYSDFSRSAICHPLCTLNPPPPILTLPPEPRNRIHEKLFFDAQFSTFTNIIPPNLFSAPVMVFWPSTSSSTAKPRTCHSTVQYCNWI